MPSKTRVTILWNKQSKTIKAPPGTGPLALPAQSTLLRGVVRIEYQQAVYLLHDANEAKGLLVFHQPSHIDLDKKHSQARSKHFGNQQQGIRFLLQACFTGMIRSPTPTLIQFWLWTRISGISVCCHLQMFVVAPCWFWKTNIVAELLEEEVRSFDGTVGYNQYA